MNSIKDMVDDLMELCETAGVDAEKVDNGNKFAGVRVRTGMKNIKKLAQDIRKEVIVVRNKG